jgi:hypothetical protein
MKIPLIAILALFGTICANAENKKSASKANDEIGAIKEPITVDKSNLIGLTEEQVLKAIGIAKLEPEGKNEEKKSFQSGRSTIPVLGGYVYTRHNIVTFKQGKVVQHQLVDRISSCVITERRPE